MKSNILYFPDKKSLMDFYKKIMETESHHRFLIKRRYHRKTSQYSILIKEEI